MKTNRIWLFVITLLLVCTAALTFTRTAQAYTEEEKAQAKAWLSAHGYSPDYDGASQAYQDYLDGKFDEELGITTNTETTTEHNESDDDTVTTEKETTPDKEKKNKAPGPKKKNPGLNNENNYTGSEGTADGKENTEGISEEVSNGQAAKTEESTQTIGTPPDTSAEWLIIDPGIDNTKMKKHIITIIFLCIVVIISFYEVIKVSRTTEFKEERKKEK